MSMGRRMFQRGTRTAPNVDLSQLKELVEQGVDANTAAKLLFGSGAGAGAAVMFGSDIAANLLTQSVPAVGRFIGEGSAAPQTVPMGGKGFIYTPQDDLQYRRDYRSPYAVLSRLFGQKMQTPEERAESQTALVNKQAEGINERDIRKIIAERQATGQIEAMKAAALLEGERVKAESALGVQEIASLGDVQKTRIQSGNEAASAMLQKAIENIAYVEKLGNDQVAAGLTNLPTI